MTRRFTSRDHQRDRAGEGHPGARRRHGRPRDGVDLRHVLDEQGPLGARRRHRQAARRSAARSAARRRPRAARSTACARRCREAGAARRRACASPSRASATSAATSRASLAEDGAKVVAVSDSTGGVYNPKGIDVPAALAHKRETGSLAGLAGHGGDHERGAAPPRLRRARAVRARAGDHGGERRPGQGEDHRRGRERPDDAGRRRRSSRTRASSILPDVLANAGGVVVSYFEWVQGLQEYFWKEDEVNAKLNDIVTPRVRRDVGDARSARRASMRDGRVRARRPARRRGDDHARAVSRSPGRPLPRARAATCASGRASVLEAAGRARRSSSRRSTSPATESSRRGTASGCRWSRSTASGRSSTTSTLVRFGASSPHKVRLVGTCDSACVAGWHNARAVTNLEQGARVADRLTVGVAARL